MFLPILAILIKKVVTQQIYYVTKKGCFKMFELNKVYSAKELATLMGISYQNFRNKRNLYESHLKKFYQFTTERKGRGNGIYYTLTHKYNDFIPYKDFANATRERTIKTAIVKTINKDNRQTGANIARAIANDDDKLADSTLTAYVRLNLKDFLTPEESENGNSFYTITDTCWCYLNKNTNSYQVMTEQEVKELRKYFNAKSESEEFIYSQFKDKMISREEAAKQLGELRLNRFAEGLRKFAEKHNSNYPIKVPVYQKCAFYNGKYKEYQSLE